MALQPDGTIPSSVSSPEPIVIGHLPVGHLWDGRYQIVAQLGEGGMSVVYQATDLALAESVALKILWPHLAADQKCLASFRAEGTIAARLHHPHIRRVFGISSAENPPYLTMEYLTGLTLEQRLTAEKPLPIRQALHIAVQLSRALGATHQKGIIHRDIKPENIFLTYRECDPNFAILYDFGCVWTPEIAHEIDMQGRVMGTPEYMAPEMALAEPLDCRADIFCMGIVLYQMLTGQLPFTGSHAMDVMRQAIYLKHRSVRSIRSEISLELATVVNVMLAKDRDDRPPDMATVESMLIKTAHELHP